MEEVSSNQKSSGLGSFFHGFNRINGGFIIISILAFVLGWQFGHRDYKFKLNNYIPEFKVTDQTPPKSTNIDFKLFWQVWDLVSTKYIDKTAIDPKKLYYGAIAGMVQAVGDPYTVFLPPSSQKATQEQLSGKFEGVGIQLGYNKDKRLVVIAPLKDTPAEKAGVRAGDLIISIDGKDTNNISLPDATSKIKGPKGTSVTLSLYTENDSKPHDISITRDVIEVKSVIYQDKQSKSGKHIALITITNFGEQTKEEWNSAVSNTLSNASQGVVIDVRNNPGGYLDAAVYILSDLFKDGTLVMQQNYQGDKTEQEVVKEGKLIKMPVIVLINKGSASASEILSGAVQDRKRGQLVGEQSFGKGTIQSTEDLPDETGIHITTAKWLTPSGRWIHGVGLTPDFKVDLGTDPKADPQLDKALELLDK